MKARNQLESALTELLSQRQHQFSPLLPEMRPIFLILTTQPYLVAFASVESNIREEYENALRRFKELYKKKSSEWGKFDLNLVLCVDEPEDRIDGIINEIETDPYFCRKFVITIGKEISTELARLPFVPLDFSSGKGTAGFRRPPTCQTFLAQNNVDTKLARALVVPGRAAQTIVKECLDEENGSPIWPKKRTLYFPSIGRQTQKQVRVKSLEIQGFRAYRRQQSFDLDADMVVLFGQNGLGKTSFFDAIDFATTGSLGRFDERGTKRSSKLQELLKHLDSSASESHVKLSLRQEDNEFDISRETDDRTSAKVSGQTRNRTEVLLSVAGLEDEPQDMRIENFVRLFRSSHLFGQEFQSLTSNVIDDSTLPEDTVSRMLAFQDYVEAIRKIEKVVGVLGGIINENTLKSRSIEDLIHSKQADLGSLGPKVLAEKGVMEETLKLDELSQKAQKTLNVTDILSIENAELVCKSWKALLTSQLASASQGLETLSNLESRLPSLDADKDQLETLQKDISDKKNQARILSTALDTKRKELSNAEVNLNKLSSEVRTLEKAKENFDWLLQTLPDFSEYRRQRSTTNEIVETLSSQRRETQSQYDEILGKEKQIGVQIQAWSEKIRSTEDMIRKLEEFGKEISGATDLAALEKSYPSKILQARKEKEEMESELRHKERDLNSNRLLLEQARRRVVELQRGQTELQSLLDAVEKHITTGVCPVCGTQHDSTIDLLEKIKRQKGYESPKLAGALQELMDLENKKLDLRNRIDAMITQLDHITTDLSAQEESLAEIQQQISSLRQRAAELGVPLVGTSDVGVVASKKAESANELLKMRAALSQQREQEEELRRRLLEVSESLRKRDAEIQRNRDQLVSIDSTLKELVEEANIRGLSFETDLAKATASGHQQVVDLAMIKSKIEEQQLEMQALRLAVNAPLAQVDSHVREISVLEEKAQSAANAIRQVETMLRSLGLEPTAKKSTVKRLEGQLSERISVLTNLSVELDNVLNILATIDSRRVAKSLKRDIDEAEVQLTKTRMATELAHKWLLYFQKMSEELGTIRRNALSEYTNQYGPIASLIQKRLRPFYGFGNISLVPSSGTIDVRIERKGNRGLRPNEYLSQSQLQIVMLGLFFSAAFTQNWSSFAPVLLDDPVTHFDDLNCYSFVDLLCGIMSTPGRGPQFIVSTCENRLIRLMQEKFSKIDAKVIYYRFDSYGDDGPKITRVDQVTQGEEPQ